MEFSAGLLQVGKPFGVPKTKLEDKVWKHLLSFLTCRRKLDRWLCFMSLTLPLPCGLLVTVVNRN